MIQLRAMLQAGLIMLLISPGVHAAIAFQNFGPGFTYEDDLGFIVGVNGFGVNSIGVRFTSEATGAFSMLWVAVNARDGTPNDGLTYSLRQDLGGAPDGVIESVVFDDVCFESQCPDGQVYSASGSGSSLLTAGERYWLVATVSDSSSGFFWFASPPGEGAGTIWVQNLLFPDGAVFDFAQPPVFRIDVLNDQPGEASEPGALALFVAMALALVTTRTIRRRQSLKNCAPHSMRVLTGAQRTLRTRAQGGGARPHHSTPVRQ